MRLLRLFRRRRTAPAPAPEGEEHEILEAERKAREQRERLGYSYVEKAGHANWPYVKDPFE